MVGAGTSPAAIDFAAVEFAVAAVWVLVVRLRVLLFGAGFSLVVRLDALLFVAIQPIVGADAPTARRGRGIWTRTGAPCHRRTVPATNRASDESHDCGYVDGLRTLQPRNVDNLSDESPTTRRCRSSFDHIPRNPRRAARNHGRLEGDAWGVGEGQPKG